MSHTNRPVTVLLLAMLNIVIGTLYLLTSPFAIMLFLAGPPTHMGVAAPKYQTAAYQGVSFCTGAITFYVAVLLIATGIGLIRMRPWAWSVSITLAIVSIAFFVLSRIGFLLVAWSGPHGEPYWLALIMGSVLLCFPQVLHPLLTFAVLLPQSNRDAYRAPILLDFGEPDSKHPSFTGGEWYCRIGKQVFGPATKQQMDEAVMEGRITTRTEIWLRGQPSVWAEDVYPHLQSSLAQPLRWLVHGPSIAPYRRSSTQPGEGWKWAMVIATVLYTTLQLTSIGLTTQFTVESMPYLVMGFAAIVAGTFALAASLFEWRWFFNGRQARGLRMFAGDVGARWLYRAMSVFVLLLGFGMIGVYGVRTLDKSRLQALTSPTARQTDVTTTVKFDGERSAQCGGAGGDPFERFDRDYRPVLGFRFELGDWDSQNVIRTIHPLFQQEPGGQIVMAQEGYHVAGLIVDSDEYVNAVRVVFAHTDGTELDLNTTYTSDWIGIPTGRQTQTLGVDQQRVVGIFGRQGLITNALGLLLSPTASRAQD